MTDDDARAAIVRTLTWFETLGYAPTRAELSLAIDTARSLELGAWDLHDHIEQMRAKNEIVEVGGRVGFPGSVERIVSTIRERDSFQPRKRRRARWVASWLTRFSSVRFVALANTTALGSARDEGDLDFFVIVRAGTIWTTRLLAGLPFRLLGMTPRPGKERDAVCLSYFIADDALDLSSHMLPDDDPYFRYWFLSLLPLSDDGVSTGFWNANESVRTRHPFAQPWIVSPDLRVGRSSIARRDDALRPAPYALLEPIARWLQLRWFPSVIRERMNRDSCVIVNDHALKFHVTDGREEYRRKYIEACARRGICV